MFLTVIAGAFSGNLSCHGVLAHLDQPRDAVRHAPRTDHPKTSKFGTSPYYSLNFVRFHGTIYDPRKDQTRATYGMVYQVDSTDPFCTPLYLRRVGGMYSKPT